MSNNKCPFCGAEISPWDDPMYEREFNCGSSKSRQSDHCNLIVRHRKLVEIVDKMIAAEKVRTARNYCGHGCPLSEQMIELINERKCEKAVQDDNSNG